MFDYNLRVTSVAFFVAYFNLSTCELIILYLQRDAETFYIDILSNQNNSMKHIYITLTVLCEKFKKTLLMSQNNCCISNPI